MFPRDGEVIDEFGARRRCRSGYTAARLAGLVVEQLLVEAAEAAHDRERSLELRPRDCVHIVGGAVVTESAGARPAGSRGQAVMPLLIYVR